MILGRDVNLPDDCPEAEEVSDNWKEQKRYVHKCKEPAWKRCVHEYLVARRESIILGIIRGGSSTAATSTVEQS